MFTEYGSKDFSGASFSLSLELGFAGNIEPVDVLAAFWTCRAVTGPWAKPDEIGRPKQDRLTSGGEGKRAPYGLLTIEAASSPIPFVLHRIREERARPSKPDPSGVTVQFGIQTQEPSDWLTVDVPVRGLEAIWPVDNTWSVASQPWLAQLCRTLADVAGHVHGQAPLLGGVMGEEASGCWRVPTPRRMGEAEQGYPPLAVLTAQVIEERGGFVVTPRLWQQLAPSLKPVTLHSGLLYVPPQLTGRLTGA